MAHQLQLVLLAQFAVLGFRALARLPTADELAKCKSDSKKGSGDRRAY